MEDSKFPWLVTGAALAVGGFFLYRHLTQQPQEEKPAFEPVPPREPEEKPAAALYLPAGQAKILPWALTRPQAQPQGRAPTIAPDSATSISSQSGPSQPLDSIATPGLSPLHEQVLRRVRQADAMLARSGGESVSFEPVPMGPALSEARRRRGLKATDSPTLFRGFYKGGMQTIEASAMIWDPRDRGVRGLRALDTPENQALVEQFLVERLG